MLLSLVCVWEMASVSPAHKSGNGNRKCPNWLILEYPLLEVGLLTCHAVTTAFNLVILTSFWGQSYGYCDNASKRWPYIRFDERKEIPITERIKHGNLIALIVIVQVRVLNLHVFCAAASLGAALHTLSPKAIEVHIHSGLCLWTWWE